MVLNNNNNNNNKRNLNLPSGANVSVADRSSCFLLLFENVKFLDSITTTTPFKYFRMILMTYDLKLTDSENSNKPTV